MYEVSISITANDAAYLAEEPLFRKPDAETLKALKEEAEDAFRLIYGDEPEEVSIMLTRLDDSDDRALTRREVPRAEWIEE